ncbi:MAG TPA: WD40 repeat domain-containing protein, partial [Anaerolineales bacterium]|nr:WD40 repeat domain-containing protein [Anaerolineales bacterium]
LYSGARLATAREGLDSGQLSLGGLPLEFVQAAIQRQEAERLARRQRSQRTIIGLAAGVVVFAVLAGISLVFWRQAQASAHVAEEQAGAAAALLGLSQERGTEAANERTQALAARATADFNASVAVAQEEEARRQATLALSRQLASQALSNLLTGEIDTALLLAVQAYQAADTPQARSALLSTIEENPRLVNLLTGQHDFVLDMAYSPDGRMLASAGCAQRDLGRENCLRGELRVWDASSGRLLAELGKQFPEIHSNAITRIAFSPNGRYLASGDRSGNVALWDAIRLQPLTAVMGEMEEEIGYLAFNSRSTVLIAGDGQTTQSWNVINQQAQGNPYIEIPELVDEQAPAAIAGDGSLLAIRTPDYLVIWDTRIVNESTRLYTGSFKDPPGSLTFDPDGNWLAFTQENEAYAISTTNAEIITQPLQGHTQRITRLAFNPIFSNVLASGGWDTSIRLWDLANWLAADKPMEQQTTPSGAAQYAPLTGHHDYITSLIFSPDGNTLASGSRDTTIRLWNWQGTPSLADNYYQGTEELFGLTYTPDGRHIAIAVCSQAAENGEDCLSSEVLLLDASSGEMVGEPMTGAANLLTNIAIDPAGKLLAAAGWEGKIYLWDLTSGESVGESLSGHTDFVTGLGFSPDGKLLASAGRDGQVLVWNVAERQLAMDRLTGHTERITSLDFSPDGTRLVTGSRDQNVIIWQINTAPVTSTTLTGHQEQVNLVRFSPDGSLAVSGSADGQMILWDVASGSQLQTIQAHKERLSALAFSPDGRSLATGSWDRTVQLWDVETGQPVGRPLSGHGDTINGLAFSPDGETLSSSSRDGTILRWNVDPAAWVQRACQIAGRALSENEWRSFAGPNVPYSPVCAAP